MNCGSQKIGQFFSNPFRDKGESAALKDIVEMMGNGSVIRTGELQRKSAGTDILHSEFNHSQKDQAHLLQIWILPARKGLEPGYEQKLFSAEEKQNRWCLVGSNDGRDGSLTIHQDIELHSANLEEDVQIAFEFDETRRGFMQVVRGLVEVDGTELAAGDAASMQDQASFSVRAVRNSELLLFNLA